MCRLALNSGSFNLLESQELVQACNWLALPFNVPRYPWDRGLGGLQRRSGRLSKNVNIPSYVSHFPTAWKHARVISILKPGKDPALPSSYRPISLLDTIGKLFEKVLLSRILHEVSVRGLMRDEQFGFRPRHNTSLQLARLVERITRNFGEKRLTGAVFLDGAKPSISSGSMASSTS